MVESKSKSTSLYLFLDRSCIWYLNPSYVRKSIRLLNYDTHFPYPKSGYSLKERFSGILFYFLFPGLKYFVGNSVKEKNDNFLTREIKKILRGIFWKIVGKHVAREKLKMGKINRYFLGNAISSTASSLP